MSSKPMRNRSMGVSTRLTTDPEGDRPGEWHRFTDRIFLGSAKEDPLWNLEREATTECGRGYDAASSPCVDGREGGSRTSARGGLAVVLSRKEGQCPPRDDPTLDLKGGQDVVPFVGLALIGRGGQDCGLGGRDLRRSVGEGDGEGVA
eukprot:CAMPEP_0206528144 /NCGR_PEP_ID=MMETSP0325_2-20121206/1778_1 /ASSEMBLY_ACC=CAM_ASM_000347 /TAXON_ID=2866 /ORGANISM="Crypthecodinium cohnii, Strain Seligo" /LENGTH=147 /DNA_ID=CAMNT_0054023707 /DNA_START=500 /DNA_END=938 /DNA_ORIENTATION=+